MKSYLINLFTTIVIIGLAYFLLNRPLPVNQDILTVEDIAEFHEMNYWVIKLPQKCKEGFSIRFYFQVGNNKPVGIGGYGISSKNLKSYSKMKLIVSSEGDYKYKFHVSKGATFNFSPLKYDFKPKLVTTGINSRSEITPNQIFMKFSSKNSISNSHILKKNECGLFYTIQPYKTSQNKN